MEMNASSESPMRLTERRMPTKSAGALAEDTYNFSTGAESILSQFFDLQQDWMYSCTLVTENMSGSSSTLVDIKS